MPDIAKCEGTGCPVKEKCYRFTAKDSEFRQSYFIEPPYKDGKCDHYWGENAQDIWNQTEDNIDNKTFKQKNL